MGWFGNRKKKSEQLVGRWSIDPADAASIDALGDVSLEFDERGNLIYIVKDSGKNQIILMTYEVNGDRIITDQPSHPSRQATNFVLAGDRLTLAFEGVPSRFVRSV